MIERIVVMVILYCAMLTFDLPKLKKQQARELFAYSIALLISAYFAADYIFSKNWQILFNVIDSLFGVPVKYIMNYFKPIT